MAKTLEALRILGLLVGLQACERTEVVVVLRGQDVAELDTGSDPDSRDVQAATDLGVDTPSDVVRSRVPDFSGPVVQEGNPPALSGGTMALSHNGLLAVLSDPEHARVHLVDLQARRVFRSITVSAGDEPGRVVLHRDGLGYVLLRSGGALLVLDTRTGNAIARWPVCAAPRGLALDEDQGVLHVACAQGTLKTLRLRDGSVQRTMTLPIHLRDVVVTAGQVFVSRQQSAEVLRVGSDGQVENLGKGEAYVETQHGREITYSAGVAWRMQRYQEGVLLLHQRALDTILAEPGEHEPRPGPCGMRMVHSTMTAFASGSSAGARSAVLPDAVLPVDFALAPDARSVWVVSAGNTLTTAYPQLQEYPLESVLSSASCATPVRELRLPQGQAVAVAVQPEGTVLVQSREPTALHFMDSGQTLILSPERVAHTGATIFHANSGQGLACASCHPEATDDGKIWQFDTRARRRTESLRGGLTGTAPYHWRGDLEDFPSLVGETFVVVMGGPALRPEQANAIEHWLDTQRATPLETPLEPARVARGAALFSDPFVGCASCHSGERYSNNATLDVGTGQAFQVPRLTGLLLRPPYMHDGCAATLLDRFGPCGGSRHGNTSQLSPSELEDLVSFLATL